MPFVPIPGVAKVAITSTNSDTGAPATNVFHAKCTPGALLTELANMASPFVTFVGTLAADLWPADVAGQDIVLTDLTTATGNQYTVPITSAVGSGASDLSGGALLAKFLTATRGRSYRGRAFLGPCRTGTFTNDSAGSIIRGQIDTALAALQLALVSLTPASDIVVASKALHLGSVILSAACETKPAYQRRRGNR
jgi:hypothetical protein